MADDGPDVERLAMLLLDHLYHGSWKGWDGLNDDERAEYRAAAAAVLADLTERGRPLPDEPRATIEWNVRLRNGEVDFPAPGTTEERAREIARLSPEYRTAVHRLVHVGPWVEASRG